MYKPVRDESPDFRISVEHLTERTQFELIEPPFEHEFRSRQTSRKPRWRNPWYMACMGFGMLLMTIMIFQAPVVKSNDYIAGLSGQMTKSHFKNVAVETLIDEPIDFTPLRELCDRTVWQDGVVLECPRVPGGMVNVKNTVLTCIRYAIEAGGAFVLPDIMARSQDNVAVLITEDIRDLDYLFDKVHLISTLEQHCPQLKVYSGPKELETYEWAQSSLDLNPIELAYGDVRQWAIADPSVWRPNFDKWLMENSTASEHSAEHPVLINIGRPVFAWPMSYETAAFRNVFGRILPFRRDARDLAAEALYELSQRYSLNLDPADPFFQRAFFGAHLRTAMDALVANWPGYDAQAWGYLEQAELNALFVIYVSSGSESDVKRFAEDAATRNIQVAEKSSLLKGESLMRLQNMTWDQQGIVDYEVLLKCSNFGGISQSSFSWNIAVRRNVLSVLDSSEAMSNGPQSLSDEFSQVYGAIGDSSVISIAIWP